LLIDIVCFYIAIVVLDYDAFMQVVQYVGEHVYIPLTDVQGDLENQGIW